MICWGLLCVTAMAGHVALWITFWNQTQGRSLPVWIVTTLSTVAKLLCGTIPVCVVAVFYFAPDTRSLMIVARTYVVASTAVGLLGIPWTWYRRVEKKRNTRHVLKETSHVVNDTHARDQSLASANGLARLLMRVPGNQVFEIECNEKHLAIPRLPPALDGLKIAHLSDLHFTGKIARSLFNEAVDAINDMDADIVAITGDLVDDPRYLSWIPVTLGRLRARHGVYVILGNHDCKLPLAKLRLLLAEVGLFSLSGRLHFEPINGIQVVLGSNELPWITPTTDMSVCPPRDDLSQFRILLAHTPDMLPWARRFDFDLMLAGHTHGGQFRLPGFGPFVCPCRLPLEYASGSIYEPPTTLHVSRGLSGEVPLRLNCRPEVTNLVMTCIDATQPTAEHSCDSIAKTEAL